MESIVAQVATAAVRASRAATPTCDPQRIVIKLEAGAPPAAIGALALAAGVELERALPQIDVYVVNARGDVHAALSLLRRHPLVEVAQREVVLSAVESSPKDSDWPEQWGLRRTGFPRAWDAAATRARTVVAIVDTGVERAHPDLCGAVLRGADFVNDAGDASDDNGHGTAVAGIVVARANNGIGIAGACWPCAILPVKVLGRDGRGVSSDVAAGIIWAADRGARVINLSLGGFATTVALTEALGYAAARDAVLVAAAGNEGSTARFYPAADQHVIGVAATDPADELYPWSNRGAWVDVAAPGYNRGTSSASPVVAALAGLIRSARPRASREDVVDAIRASAVLLGAIERGRVDAARAIAGAPNRVALRKRRLQVAAPTTKGGLRSVHRPAGGAG